MGIKYTEYRDKLTHHTIVDRDTADEKMSTSTTVTITARNGDETRA